MGGKKVKDLGLLGRPLERIALLDNTPSCFTFQPRNGIPIVSWYGDETDTALLDMLPLLDKLYRVREVYDVLDEHAAKAY
jgi:TFIIF-interacting CTD phosphatase-like protein